MAAGEDPSAGEEKSGRGFLAFWSSLPGVLTGIAAVLTAVIGLIGLWRSLDDGNEAAAPTSTTSATTVATTPSGTLREGSLTLRDNDTANLRAKRVGTGDPEADLSLQGSGNPDFGILYAPYGGLLTEAGGATDKAGCVAALTTRSSDRVKLADLDPGSALCLKTHAGTIALLHIVSPPAIGSPQLVLDYVLWP